MRGRQGTLGPDGWGARGPGAVAAPGHPLRRRTPGEASLPALYPHLQRSTGAG